MISRSPLAIPSLFMTNNFRTDFPRARRSAFMALFFLFFAIALFSSGCATTPKKEAPSQPLQIEFPAQELPSIEEIRRGYLLEALHPELADRARLLYLILEVEGIEIVFISGHRPYDPNYRPNRLATWHNFGLAFDLNIVGRPYAYFPEDEPKWERIGEIAAGLGLLWGRRYDDIFHFEWHPGYYARIRDHEFQRLQGLAGRRIQNHPAVFPLFDPHQVEPEEPSCFGGCLIIPDDGLRALLEALR